MECGENSLPVGALHTCTALGFTRQGPKQLKELKVAVGAVVKQLCRWVDILKGECSQREALIKETWLALQRCQRRAHQKQWITYSRLRSQASNTAPPTIIPDKVQALQKAVLSLQFERKLAAELLRKVRCKLVLAVLFGARMIARARCALADEALWRYKEPLLRPTFWSLWRNVLRCRKKRVENGRPSAAAHLFWRAHTLLRHVRRWARHASRKAVLRARVKASLQKRAVQMLARSWSWWKAWSWKRKQSLSAIRKSWEWYSARTQRVCLRAWHSVVVHRKQITRRLLVPGLRFKPPHEEGNEGWQDLGLRVNTERFSEMGKSPSGEPLDDSPRQRPVTACHVEGPPQSHVMPPSPVGQSPPSQWAAALLRQIDASLTSAEQQGVPSPLARSSPDRIGPRGVARDSASIIGRDFDMAQGQNFMEGASSKTSRLPLQKACSVYYAKSLLERGFRAWRMKCERARSGAQLARAFSERSIAYRALCSWRQTCIDCLRIAQGWRLASLAKWAFLSWQKHVRKRVALGEKLDSALRGRRHHALSLALWGWQDWSVNKRKQRERVARLASGFLRQRSELAFVCWRKEARRQKGKRSAQEMGRKATLGMCWRHWAGGAKARVLLRRVFSAAEFRWAVSESLPSHHSEFQSAVRCLTAWHAFTLQQVAQKQEEVRTGAADVYNRARLLTKAFQVLRRPVDESRAQKANRLFSRKLLWAWRKWSVRKREGPEAAVKERVREVSGCRSIGAYRRRRVLRSIVRAWKRVVDEKRQESAAFRAARIQSRALVAWRSLGEEKNERVAAYIEKRSAEKERHVLHQWRKAVWLRKEWERKVQIGRSRRNRQLRETGLALWRAYCQDRRRKQANCLIAQRHAAFFLKSRAFKRWQWRLEWRDLKAKAHRLHERRLKKLTWRALIRHARESKVVRALTNGMSTRGTFKALSSMQDSPRRETSSAVKKVERSPLQPARKATAAVFQGGGRSPKQSPREALVVKTLKRSTVRPSSDQATRVAGRQVEKSPKASPRVGLSKSRLGAKRESEKNAQRGSLLRDRSREEDNEVMGMQERESTKSENSSYEADTQLQPEGSSSIAGEGSVFEHVTPRGTLSDFVSVREESGIDKTKPKETGRAEEMQGASTDSPRELILRESPRREKSNETLIVEIDPHQSFHLDEARELYCDMERLAGQIGLETRERLGESLLDAATLLSEESLGSSSSPIVKAGSASSVLTGGLEQESDASLRESEQGVAETDTAGRSGRPADHRDLEAEVVREGRRRSRAVNEEKASSQKGAKGKTHLEERDKGWAAEQLSETQGALKGSLPGRARIAGESREIPFRLSPRERAPAARKKGEAPVRKAVRRNNGPRVDKRPQRLSYVESVLKGSDDRRRRKSASDASTPRLKKEVGAHEKRTRASQGSEISPGRVADGVSPWAVEDSVWSLQAVNLPESAPPSEAPFNVPSQEPSETPAAVGPSGISDKSELEAVALGREMPSTLQKGQAEVSGERTAEPEPGQMKDLRWPDERLTLPTDAAGTERQKLRGVETASDVQVLDGDDRKLGENEALKEEGAHEREQETLRERPERRTCWVKGNSEALGATLEFVMKATGDEGRPEARQPDVIEGGTLEAQMGGAWGMESKGDREEGRSAEETERGKMTREEVAASKIGDTGTRGGEEKAGMVRISDEERAAEFVVQETEKPVPEKTQERSGRVGEEGNSASWAGNETFHTEQSVSLLSTNVVPRRRVAKETSSAESFARQACTAFGTEVISGLQEAATRGIPLEEANAEGLNELIAPEERVHDATRPQQKLSVAQEHARTGDRGRGQISGNQKAAIFSQGDADALHSSAKASGSASERRSAVQWPPGRLPRGSHGPLHMTQAEKATNRTRHASLVRWPLVHCEGSGPQSAKLEDSFAGDEFVQRSIYEEVLVNEDDVKAKGRRASAPSTTLEYASAGLQEKDLVRAFKVVEPECLLGPKHWVFNEVEMLG